MNTTPVLSSVRRLFEALAFLSFGSRSRAFVALAVLFANDGFSAKEASDPNAVPPGVYYALPRTAYSVKLKVRESFELMKRKDTEYAYPTFNVTGYEIAALTEPDPETGYFLGADSGFWKINGFGLELSPEGLPSKGSLTKAGGGYVLFSHVRDVLSVVAPLVGAVTKAAGVFALSAAGGKTIPEEEWAAELFRSETATLKRIVELQAEVRKNPGSNEEERKQRDARLAEIVRLRAELTRELTCEYRVEPTRAKDDQGNPVMKTMVMPVNVPTFVRAGRIKLSESGGEGALVYQCKLEAAGTLEPVGPLVSRSNGNDVPIKGATTKSLVVRLPVACRFGFTLTANATLFVGDSKLANALPSKPADVFKNLIVTVPQAGPLTTISADASFFSKRTISVTYHQATGTLSTFSTSSEGVAAMATEIQASVEAISDALKKPDPQTETEKLVEQAERVEAKLRLVKAEEELRAFTDQPVSRDDA